jgi:hypothetical protein
MAPILKKFIMGFGETYGLEVLVGENRKPSDLAPGVAPRVPHHQRWIPGGKLLHPNGQQIATLADIGASAVAPYLFGQRSGVLLTWKDNNTFTVEPGTIWFEDGPATVGAAFDIDLSNAGDRESGVADTSATTYYIWATKSGSTFVAKYDTEAPTLKGQGHHASDGRVYLGACRNNGVGNLVRYEQYVAGNIFFRNTIVNWLAVGVSGKILRVTGEYPPNFVALQHVYIVSGGAAYCFHGTNAGTAGLVAGTNDNAQMWVQLDGSSRMYTQVLTAGTGYYYNVGWMDPYLPV